MLSQRSPLIAENVRSLTPIGEIAKQTPHTADFLRQLARSGKIEAFKISRDWVTTPESILKYVRSQQARYQKKLAALEVVGRGLL